MQIELLSPAGSYEGFEAAIGAGADAVYAGGAAFGARAYAKNFNQEELIRAIETAHIHGKKLYLTVNTLVKNREMQEQLFEYLLPYYEAGLDAVIVQDLGVFQFIQEHFPNLPLHVSTQMTVTGPLGMKFLEEKGASRVVAARELSLSELKKMHEACSIEIEAFVHGALCYSFSGQCLMSSLFGGRSGNRGRCAQPCRLPYEVSAFGKKFSGGKEQTPLNLKDICTIDLLPEILDAGVTSLKIEGRMKQPQYTAGVTAMYRKYLDKLFAEGSEAYQVEEADRRFLINIFNRGGCCEGYYKQHNGPSMMAFSNEKKTGEVSFEMKKRKEKIKGTLLLYPGSAAILEVSCKDVSVSVCDGEVQFAKSQPMEEARIRQQMEKIGNTEYEWENLDIQMDEHIFVPVRLLNDLRREALKELEKELLRDKKRSLPLKENVTIPEKKQVRKEKLPLYVSCETLEQFCVACKKEEITGFYVPYDVMKYAMQHSIEKELYLALPHIVRGEMPQVYKEQISQWISKGMKGFLVRNLEGYQMLREMGYSKKCVLDSSMYTWNQKAMEFWNHENILRDTVPVELNEKELRHRDNHNSEMQVYGYLPVMLSAQCLLKNTEKCDKKQQTTCLKDRYDKIFTARCYCDPWKTGNTAKQPLCYNMIYNSLAFGLLKEKKQVENLGISGIRMAFTLEDSKETEIVLNDFINVYVYGKEAQEKNYTKGHFKRGAE